MNLIVCGIDPSGGESLIEALKGYTAGRAFGAGGPAQPDADASQGMPSSFEADLCRLRQLLARCPPPQHQFGDQP
jgi:hypothetical protein